MKQTKLEHKTSQLLSRQFRSPFGVVLVVPIYHRFMHQFHLDLGDKKL